MLFDRVYRLLIGQPGTAAKPAPSATGPAKAALPKAATAPKTNTGIQIPGLPGVHVAAFAPTVSPTAAKTASPAAAKAATSSQSQPSQSSQGGGVEITDLRISFSIEKTSDKNPNTNKVSVWNLTRATRKQLEKPDTKIILYAGYAEDRGPLLIFQGGISYASSKRDGPDIITEFELKDGGQEYRDTTISKGYNKGVKSTQVLNDAAKQMGLPLNLASNLPEREWKNGLSYYGSARGLLDKVTKGTGLEWSIQNGNLQVIEKGMVTTRQGIEIAVDSGMVGSPERERENKGETKKKGSAQQQWDGWKVKTLLMPDINPGDRVMLKSMDVEGVFRVESLTHTGDNWEGDWQTELKLVDPAKPIGGKKSSKGGHSSRGGHGDNEGGE